MARCYASEHDVQRHEKEGGRQRAQSKCPTVALFETRSFLHLLSVQPTLTSFELLFRFIRSGIGFCSPLQIQHFLSTCSIYTDRIGIATPQSPPTDFLFLRQYQAESQRLIKSQHPAVIMVSLFNILLTVVVFAGAQVVAAPAPVYSLGPRIPNMSKNINDIQLRALRDSQRENRAALH